MIGSTNHVTSQHSSDVITVSTEPNGVSTAVSDRTQRQLYRPTIKDREPEVTQAPVISSTTELNSLIVSYQAGLFLVSLIIIALVSGIAVIFHRHFKKKKSAITLARVSCSTASTKLSQSYEDPMCHIYSDISDLETGTEKQGIVGQCKGFIPVKPAKPISRHHEYVNISIQPRFNNMDLPGNRT